MLETWYSGTEGGNAIADVLFGHYNPSGKLPVSFPRSVGQIPTDSNHLNTSRPYLSDSPRAVTSRYCNPLQRNETRGASVVVKNTIPGSASTRRYPASSGY